MKILRPLAGFAFTALILGFATSALADFKIKSNGAMKIESDNGDYELEVGGRLQQDYNSFDGVINKSEDETESDFFTRRARLSVSGKAKDWSYKFSYNFTDDGSVDVLSIAYNGLGKMLRLTIGQQKEYFGLEEAGSSKWTTGIERSMPSNGFTFGKNVGLSVRGANKFVTYSLGTFQENIEASGNELDHAVTGRLVIRPLKTKDTILHLGAGFSKRRGQFDSLSARLGVRGGEEKTANSVGVEYDGAVARDLQAWNLEAAAILGRYHIMAEYFDVELIAADTVPSISATGYYFQFGWSLTGERRKYKTSSGAMDVISSDRRGGAWEVFGRIDNLDVNDNQSTPLIDIDGGTGMTATIGLNWYATDSIKLAVNFVRAQTDRTIGGRDNGSAIAARLQYVF